MFALTSSHSSLVLFCKIGFRIPQLSDLCVSFLSVFRFVCHLKSYCPYFSIKICDISLQLSQPYSSNYYIYPKYWDTLTSYQTCRKIWKFHYLLMCLKYSWMSGKQCRPWSDAALQHLIRIYSVCTGLPVPILMYSFLSRGSVVVFVSFTVRA